MTPPAEHPKHDHPFRAGPSRRWVLRTAGLALASGGAVALAACAGKSSATTGQPPSAPTSASPTAEPSSSAPLAAGHGTTHTARPAPKAPSGPSVAASDVPVGGGVVMDNADYVVTQPTSNEYKAFSKTCTHAGCPVARVADQQIQCDCHGSRFSITDGSVLVGPAMTPLPESKVALVGGRVVVGD